jgi:hypothetical protein
VNVGKAERAQFAFDARGNVADVAVDTWHRDEVAEERDNRIAARSDAGVDDCRKIPLFRLN